MPAQRPRATSSWSPSASAPHFSISVSLWQEVYRKTTMRLSQILKIFTCSLLGRFCHCHPFSHLLDAETVVWTILATALGSYIYVDGGEMSSSDRHNIPVYPRTLCRLSLLLLILYSHPRHGRTQSARRSLLIAQPPGLLKPSKSEKSITHGKCTPSTNNLCLLTLRGTLFLSEVASSPGTRMNP